MRISRWLQQQTTRRLSLIIWAFDFLVFGAIDLAAVIGVGAYHPGQPLHMPPLWVVPLQALTTAGMAGSQTRAIKNGKRKREARAATKNAQP